MLPRFLRREAAVALALSALLLWAPLPFGSVTPAAQMLFRLASLGILALALAGYRHLRLPSRGLPVAALTAIALLGLVQACGWPAGLTSAVSPEHARLYREAAAMAPEVADPSFIPLTLGAAVSRSSALSWLAAAALLAAALLAGRRTSHRRWLLQALVAAALIQLVVGLVSLWQSAPSGLARLLHPGGRLLGTFTNPNHLSLFFEMVMAAVAGWAWYEATRSRAVPLWRRLRILWPLSLWMLLLTGVAFTGSRSGLVAAAVGFAVQAACMPMAARGRRPWVPALIFCIVVAALAGLASRREIGRYQAVSLFEDNLRSRMLVVQASLELWRRFPVTGTGLGTFEDAFPAVAPAGLTKVVWNRAHNDPVELLVTGGVAGLGLGLLAMASLLWPIWRLTRHGLRSEDRAAGLAALGAVGAAGFHELLDFGLVIPANHLALLVILGAAAAVSPPRSSPPG